jgi:hypothetical protein
VGAITERIAQRRSYGRAKIALTMAQWASLIAPYGLRILAMLLRVEMPGATLRCMQQDLNLRI